MERDGALQDLRDHQKEIYTLKWSPAGRGSANPTAPLLLATASFDATVRLWDARSGQCLGSVHVRDSPLSLRSSAGRARAGHW